MRTYAHRYTQDEVYHTWVPALEVIRSINTGDRNYTANSHKRQVWLPTTTHALSQHAHTHTHTHTPHRNLYAT